MTALLVANAVGAAASVVFAVLGALRPAALSGSGAPTAGERFYGWMYAVRGIPLGVVAGVVPLLWSGPAAAAVLYAAAAAQVGDAAIGVGRGKGTMIVGASVLAVLHGVTGVGVG